MNLDQFFTDNPEWRPYADLVVVPPSADELAAEFPDANEDVLAKCCSGSGFITVGTLYTRIRREGADDRWAAMLALKSFPGIQTSDTFWAGRPYFHQLYGTKYANQVKAMLAKRGVAMKAGDEYCPSLARFKGDPEAVIPFNGARSYIKNLCARRGIACDGAVTTKHREPESDPHAQAIPMAEDLLRANARRMIAKNPDLKRLDKRELRQVVLEKHGQQK